MSIDIIEAAKYIGALMTILTPLFFLLKHMYKLHEDFKKIQKITKYQDEQIVESLKQRKLIIISLLAVMDGLKQMGCNHNVSTQHQAIKNYLNDQPFKADWYKENKDD